MSQIRYSPESIYLAFFQEAGSRGSGLDGILHIAVGRERELEQQWLERQCQFGREPE